MSCPWISWISLDFMDFQVGILEIYLIALDLMVYLFDIQNNIVVLFLRRAQNNGAELNFLWPGLLKLFKKWCSRVLSCHCRVSLGHAAWWISSQSVSTPLSFYVISLQSIDNISSAYLFCELYETIVCVGSANSWNSCRFLEFIYTIGSVNSWNSHKLLEFIFILEYCADSCWLRLCMRCDMVRACKQEFCCFWIQTLIF